MERTSLLMRPVDGYQEQGAQAWFDNLPTSSCPHSPVSIAESEWLLGYSAEALYTTDGDPWDDDVLRFTDISLHARAARSFAEGHARWLLPDAETAAAAIGIPCSEWPSRCKEIADTVLASGLLSPLIGEHGTPMACYGFYEGPVTAASVFSGRSLCRHGWIEFPSGLVVDPTRWVFDGNPPSLWCGSSEDYDLAMRRARTRTCPRPLPKFDGTEPSMRLTANDADILGALASALDDPELPCRMTISRSQAFWLANSPPERFGENAQVVFSELVRIGAGGLIPMDTKAQLAHVREDGPEEEPSFRM